MFQWMRPPAKIGQVTLGPNDQNLLFAKLPSLLTSLAETPKLPVRKNLGNRSAVATPMRAVAAWIWASARRMSGRRRSSSEGRPTGIACLLYTSDAADDLTRV